MNLTLFKDFLTCHANLEDRRIKNIKTFLSNYPKIGMFSLFKQLTFGSVPELNAIHFQKYMTQFSNNLQIVQPNQINIYNRQKDVSSKKSLSQDQILQKGVNLFLKAWGNSSRQFSFAQFTKFMKGQVISPQKAVQVPYPAKKKLYQIFQSEIQGLLNIQTLRQICVKQYKNITDLFQNLASTQTHKIDKKSLNNLYLMHSQRMDDHFLTQIQKRLNLPMDFNKFLQIFKKDSAQQNKKLKQRKIYFSSAKRKKDRLDYFDQSQSDVLENSRDSISYNTPKTHKIANGRNMTSTKLTKGQKVAELRQASISINKFGSPQAQKFVTSKQIQILGQILSLQEAFIQLKRNLCLKKDFDLQLVYERQGHKFQTLLNEIFGCSNFTSFVRFVVPQDFQHRYLTFVRFQRSNTLSNEIIQMINDLLQSYDRKEIQIERLWQKIDREMIFRMYCNPCDNGIRGQQLMKYFTQRQCRVLLQRMDPLKTGQIIYQNFK